MSVIVTNPQIQKLIYYIENHLDDELQLDHLAKIAGYSPFHFCRIFKIYIGESVIAYATRLKLERAARKITFENMSMIEIALDAGYKTPTGFIKAFKSRFGTTPTKYQQDQYIHYNKYSKLDMKTPQIVTREAVDVVFVRELGGYEQSSTEAWKKLSLQLESLSDTQLDLSEGEALGLCYDDPKVTDPLNLRYEAAHTWNKHDIAKLQAHGLETKSMSGGRYAKVKYIGISQGEATWYGLYMWIEKSNYTFRDAPSFEKYLNGTCETNFENLEVEVYVPIH